VSHQTSSFVRASTGVAQGSFQFSFILSQFLNFNLINLIQFRNY
jgi:hypothetical protein